MLNKIESFTLYMGYSTIRYLIKTSKTLSLINKNVVADFWIAA